MQNEAASAGVYRLLRRVRLLLLESEGIDANEKNPLHQMC